MPLYRYLKTPPPKAKKKKPVWLSLLFITIGVGILGWVSFPMLSFLVVMQEYFVKTASPLADGVVFKQSPVVLAAESDIQTTVRTDYTNVNSWFPGRPQQKVVTPVNSYRLTIPKLKINNATVVINGDDLSKSLIHYGGTGLPGEYGNSVVFGHSTIVQLFNPLDYKTIFATLPTLKLGDEFLIDYDGITYRYQIFEMVVNNPNDLTALEQRFDDSYVTLVTCVPPGTYLMRLYVKAKLVKL